MDRGANRRAIPVDRADGISAGPIGAARARTGTGGRRIALLTVAAAVLIGVAAVLVGVAAVPASRPAAPVRVPTGFGAGPVAPIAFGAGQGTPGAGTAVAQPGPEECRVAPRSLDDLRRLNVDAVRAAETVVAVGVEGAVAAGLAPFNLYTPVPVPPAAADAAAVAGVNATLRETAACGAAGEQLRVWALFSDAFFVRTRLLFGPADEDDLALTASPVAAPPDEREPFAPVAPEDVRLLADGRVAVLVPAPATRPGGSPPPTNQMLFLFVRVGDRYLFDDQWFVLPEGATPVAGPSRATASPIPGVGSTATPGTTLIVLADVPLRAAASAAAAAAGRLAEGQVVEATGSIEEIDGETWAGVADPASGASGFVPARLLVVAINEIRVTGSSTARVNGTEVPITPSPNRPTVTPASVAVTATSARTGTPDPDEPAVREAIAERLTAWRATSDLITGGTSSTSFAVAADRLLAGDSAAAADARLPLDSLLDDDPSRCRAAIAVVGARGVDEADGEAVAARVAELMRARVPDPLGDAPLRTVGVAGGERGEVTVTVVFAAGCEGAGPAGPPAVATPVR